MGYMDYYDKFDSFMSNGVSTRVPKIWNAGTLLLQSGCIEPVKNISIPQFGHCAIFGRSMS